MAGGGTLLLLPAPRRPQPRQHTPPGITTAYLERLDDAEQAGCRHPRSTAGEEAPAEADRRKRGEEQTGAGELASILLLDSRPQLTVDELDDRVGSAGELLRVNRVEEGELDPARLGNRP